MCAGITNVMFSFYLSFVCIHAQESTEEEILLQDNVVLKLYLDLAPIEIISQ